jgi:hypothetical protein
MLAFLGSLYHDLPSSLVVTSGIKPSLYHFSRLITCQTHVLCNLIVQYQFQTDLFTAKSWLTQEETYRLALLNHHKKGIS